MPDLRVEHVDEVDLDEVVGLLHGRWSPARLRWRLTPPAGPGRVVTGGDSAVLAVPAEVRHLGQREVVWQVVDATGPQVDALLHGLREEVRAPLIRIGKGAPSGDGWHAVDELPTWVTGPDPFVPTQRICETLDARHDSFGEAIARRAERALHRDAATWTWRYLRDPDHTHVLMDVPDRDGISGLIVLRVGPVRGVRTVAVMELHALDQTVHYALLKAARRLSWDEGGRPVVLWGERMSRVYAFTAGYVPAGSPLKRAPMTVHADDADLAGPWRAWRGDL